ncbi:unnamed protein product [Darwinula stevensoni]|uniref:Limulus clotting factor C n=1 Tax=Darwinula stevensoni TaxID=69355 RepID=A0A7R9A428_9CRUS|nr:unnamed protein product [Darwinula stevensoni]CAG0892797.1 unnamed protein product [Darwinula stevensoni]
MIYDSNLPEATENNNMECIQDGKYVTGSVVKYNCNQYYILSGSRLRKCTENGEWSGTPPFCTAECGSRGKLQRTYLSRGGRPSGIGTWPWQAAIYGVQEKDVICGGALIGEQWVLTAAHCVVVRGSSRVRAPEHFRVHLGTHYRNESLGNEYVQIIEVSRIIQYETYTHLNYDSDIALLKLSKPVKLTSRVQLICLPSPEFPILSEENLKNGNLGWVAAWGHDSSNNLSDELMEIEIPVVSNDICHLETTHFADDPNASKSLTGNTFCAGHDRNTSPRDYKTVCRGDSGSPMAFYTRALKRWQVEGIVSHYFGSDECSERGPGQYGVFTRVSR